MYIKSQRIGHVLKKYFLSFANSRMLPSLERIEAQAVQMNVFDQVIICTEKNLAREFRKEFSSKMYDGARGFGYWCWKPQIIKQCLNRMNDGDELLYLDAGCHLNIDGRKRLLDYFKMSEMCSSGMVAFQLEGNLESMYNKADLLEYFGVRFDEKVVGTGQYMGGAVVLRKNVFSYDIISRWREVFSKDFHLVDDSASVIPNFPDFREHRHDQSVFSILCKMSSVETISGDEVYPRELDKLGQPDWTYLSSFPIHTRRDKVLRRKTIFERFEKHLRKYK